MKSYLLGVAASVALSGAALAQEPFRIGFLSTMSGVSGVLGQDQRRGFDLALEQLGGKIGGLPVQVVEADDKFSAADGVQQHDTIVLEQAPRMREILVEPRDADMLEHADRDDALERPLDVAIILKPEIGAPMTVEIGIANMNRPTIRAR